MHEVFVAIWSVQVSTIHGLTLLEKQARMNRAVVKASMHLRAAAKRMNAVRPVYVFAAPEYYWLKPAFQLYDEADKNNIYGWCRSLSSSFQGLILFPGTVNWQRPKRVAGDKAFDGYNSAPVYQNGELLLDYDKKFNDGAVDGALGGVAAFLPGGRGADHARQDFRADGLHFGLDVCGDLNAGQLQLTLGAQQVDVMVVISASMAHHFGNSQIHKIAVRNGGAFIQCDSSHPSQSKFRNGVWALNRGKGMHGTAKDTTADYQFRDLDGVQWKIAVPRSGDPGAGNTLALEVVQGSGQATTVTATGVERSEQHAIRKFTLLLSGRKPQTAAFVKARGKEEMVVTLTRKHANPVTLTIAALPTVVDDHGTQFTGTGNVTKISRLLPDPDLQGLVCYHLPVPPLA